jgi:transposase
MPDLKFHSTGLDRTSAATSSGGAATNAALYFPASRVSRRERFNAKALAKVLPHLDIEIVKRSDQVSGFMVLPKRWIVERTIAWLNRCRRLAKDWENLNRKALAFLRLASIRLMLRKLCNPT